MKLVMIACSKRAYQLMGQITEKWLTCSPKDEIIGKVKCSSMPELSEGNSLSECVGEYFDQTDAIIFLCATGIAVRSIAPYIKHKSKDPGVVVVDETGKFSVALLAGHTGGANELAEQIAALIGAIPVITTATDLEGKFAVDEFARKNHFVLEDWELAKEISVCILQGESIGLCVESPMKGTPPIQLCVKEQAEAYHNKKEKTKGIWVSYRELEEKPFTKTLQLVPREIIVGIGCKKGTTQEVIRHAIQDALKAEHIMPEAVMAIASISLKKEEEGILAYCKTEKLPFYTYLPNELEEAEGNFSSSDFVKKITGVSNVCERSAVSAAQGGELLCHKKIDQGVAIAFARKKGSVII